MQISSFVIFAILYSLDLDKQNILRQGATEQVMSLQYYSVSLGVIWSNLIHEVMTRARVSREAKCAPSLPVIA